jgi:hypothetical protein
MEEMILTFARGNEPIHKIVVPSKTIEIADNYAVSIGLLNTEHLVMKLLLENLLKGVILPLAKYSPEESAQMTIMEEELAAKKRELDIAKITPLLPTLLIGDVVTSLTAIDAAAKARQVAMQSNKISETNNADNNSPEQ